MDDCARHERGEEPDRQDELAAGERAWTQSDLAARLKVSRQSVNAIETERYEPSLSLAFAIAKLFEQPIETIFRPGRG
ncbi:MAG: helix-turn-helix transcriptional regulator [Gammaproteobacteria bacterium]